MWHCLYNYRVVNVWKLTFLYGENHFLICATVNGAKLLAHQSVDYFWRGVILCAGSVVCLSIVFSHRIILLYICSVNWWNLDDWSRLNKPKSIYSEYKEPKSIHSEYREPKLIHSEYNEPKSIHSEYNEAKSIHSKYKKAKSILSEYKEAK